MSNKSKSEIQALHDKIKAATKRLERRLGELDEAETDAAQLAAAIEEIGVPHYKDDAAINKLAATKLKLASCQDVIAKLTEEVEAGRKDCGVLLSEGCALCAELLGPVIEANVDTIAERMLPGCEDKAEARNLAKNTKAYLAMTAAQKRYATLFVAPSYIGYPANLVLEAYKKIVAVTTESLSANPNLNQFICPPAKATGA